MHWESRGADIIGGSCSLKADVPLRMNGCSLKYDVRMGEAGAPMAVPV